MLPPLMYFEKTHKTGSGCRSCNGAFACGYEPHKGALPNTPANLIYDNLLSIRDLNNLAIDLDLFANGAGCRTRNDVVLITSKVHNFSANPAIHDTH